MPNVVASVVVRRMQAEELAIIRTWATAEVGNVALHDGPAASPQTLRSSSSANSRASRSRSCRALRASVGSTDASSDQSRIAFCASPGILNSACSRRARSAGRTESTLQTTR